MRRSFVLTIMLCRVILLALLTAGPALAQHSVPLHQDLVSELIRGGSAFAVVSRAIEVARFDACSVTDPTPGSSNVRAGSRGVEDHADR